MSPIVVSVHGARRTTDSDTRRGTLIGAYHVAMMGEWRRIVDEQTRRLADSGLLSKTDHVIVGVVGGVLGLNDFCPELAEKATIVCNHDLKRYEFHTLKLLQGYAFGRKFKAWYIHTKGASRPGDLAMQDWRLLMEHFVVSRFEYCVRELDSCDACGVNRVSAPLHFSGNFWWANSGYLAALKAVEEMNWSDRIAAEMWIGTGGGKLKSLFNSGIEHWVGSQRYDVEKVAGQFPVSGSGVLSPPTEPLPY